MKKFTKVLENVDNQKYFEISAEIKLSVKVSNEGEAGYLADSIIGAIEEQTDFRINNIEEISKEDYQKYFETYGIGFEGQDVESDISDKIISNWIAEFGDRTPTTSEKMEFYHKMRNVGFDGILIMNTLKNKISDTWMKKQSEI